MFMTNRGELAYFGMSVITMPTTAVVMTLRVL